VAPAVASAVRAAAVLGSGKSLDSSLDSRSQ
jgi:hypothetical protein